MANLIKVENLTISAELLSAGAINNLVTKTNGGSISAAVDIVQHDINILSGNYIQTNTPENIYVHSAGNSFLQAESIKYGNPIVGTKAYCILSAIPDENAFVISGDFGYNDIASKKYPTQSSERTFRDGLGNESVSLTLKQSLINTSNANPSLSDLMWSMALFNVGNTNFGHLTAVESIVIDGIAGFKLKFDKIPDDVENAVDGKILADYINDFVDVNGDNALYVRGFAELGNQIPPQFIVQHIEGGATRAIGKYTHAEGRDTIADGRYAHAEGTATIAGGVASHSEGQSCRALGRSSHAEGEGTYAKMPMSHSEGYQAVADAAGAHAEGGYWLSSNYTGNFAGGKATGKSAHAEGGQTSAIGIASHAEGYRSKADGEKSHSEGQETTAFGDYSHAEGYKSITELSASHAEGYITKALGNYASHSEGYQTVASGDFGSHSEGHTTSAFGNYSHAEGKETLAKTGAHAEGLTCIANAYGSHAEGYGSLANGQYSHVEGNGSFSSKIQFALCSDLSTLYLSSTANVLSSLSSYAKDLAFVRFVDNVDEPINQIASYELVGNELCINLTAQVTSNIASPANVVLYKKIAKSTAAHAEGYDTRAIAGHSHAEGYKSIADGSGAHAEGGYWWGDASTQNSAGGHASGKGSHAEGFQTFVLSSADAAHAEGYQTSALYKYSHAEGNNTMVSAQASHAEGQSTVANGNYSHAEGYQTSAFQDGAHAEGFITKADGQGAHAEGYHTIAQGKHTHAAGHYGKALHDQSWCWNGWENKAYESKGKGTFCINPLSSELSNVYIGANNFIACIANAFSKMTDSQKNTIKTALGIS